jgi:putative ABC transport system permease protein
LTLPLLVGAAALTRSFSALMAVEPGFQTANLVTMHMAIPRTKYKSDAEIAALYGRLVDQVQAVPGIVSAAMVNRLPLSGNNMGTSVQFDPSSKAAVSLQARSVTPGYFQTMGIALREGRVVAESDRANAPLVVVIDERVARAQFPGEGALGKRLQLTVPGERKPASAEIVGVVANIRHDGLETDTDRQIYFSYQQFTDGRIVLVAKSRAGMDARAATAAVIDAVRAVDPEQPVYDVRTMEDVVARSTGARWLNLAVVAAFAASSLLLASVGLYGVVAYGVAERVREFGVRLALGARPSDVSRMVLRQGAMLAMIGAALGVGGAIGLALAMRSLLFSIQPLDPIVFGVAGVLLVGVSLVASYVPARRASLIDPARALRSE